MPNVRKIRNLTKMNDIWRSDEQTSQAGGVNYGLALGGPKERGHRDDAVLHLCPLRRRLGDALGVVENARLCIHHGFCRLHCVMFM